jgi:putative effector of murein hydrolase
MCRVGEGEGLLSKGQGQRVTAVVRLATIMAVVVVGVGVWMSLAAQFQHDVLPRGFTSPVLAMEMARSMKEAKMIVGEPGHSDRSEMCAQ